MSVLREYAIAAYFAYFSRVRVIRVSHIFPHKMAVSMTILIILIFSVFLFESTVNL